MLIPCGAPTRTVATPPGRRAATGSTGSTEYSRLRSAAHDPGLSDSTSLMLRSRRATSFFDLEPEAAVRVAYQVILGREPDADRAASWVRGLAKGELDRRELCEALIASPEFAPRYRNQVAQPVGRTGGEPFVAKMSNGSTIHLATGDWLISDNIAQTGLWEPHITAFLNELLKPGDLFVDVGANLGYFTLLAANAVGPEGHVIAFEPVPRNVQLLLASIVTNGYRNIDVWPVALGLDRDIVAFAVDDTHTNALISSAPTDTWGVALAGDVLLANVPLHRASVVKIDVEGYEHPALAGMHRFLVTHKPTVVLEFHPGFIEHQGQDVDAELAFLFEHFKAIEVLSHGGDLVTMSDPAEVLKEWSRVNEEADLDDDALFLDLVARPSE